MEVKVILTGATEMVGEGVLLECLEHPMVKEVLINGVLKGYPKQILEVTDIKLLAKT